MSVNQAKINALQSLAHGSITTGYVAVGSILVLPLSMFRLINNTDGDVFFSIDGVTDQFFVPAASFVLYDVAANRGINQAFNVPGSVQFYVKYSTSPSKNAVYVESISPNIVTPTLPL
jgi:hypothetical protein